MTVCTKEVSTVKDKPVYTTGQAAGGKSGDLRERGKEKGGYVKSAGPAKMRLETKGRGGKAVTLLFNLPFDEPQAVGLMKDLQASLGCGATFKDGAIELRGDLRDRIEAWFVKQGWKLVRAGG